MGLFEALFGKAEGLEPEVVRPASLAVSGAPDEVLAICSGELMSMADIPDPVFAAGAMGMAVGIKPADGTIYAPVSGVITLTTGTLHAVGLTADDGVSILIHLGVDTVNMNGDGFVDYVKEVPTLMHLRKSCRPQPGM